MGQVSGTGAQGMGCLRYQVKENSQFTIFGLSNGCEKWHFKRLF